MGLEYKRIMKNEARIGRYLTNEAGKETESTDQESRKVNAVRTKKELPKRVHSRVLHQGHSKSRKEFAKFGAMK